MSAEAEADVDEAAAWYEAQSGGLGVAFVAAVRAALGRVGDQPEAYAEVRAGVRRVPTPPFPYGAFYRSRGDRVEVIGVFHDRRAPGAWQRRAKND